MCSWGTINVRGVEGKERKSYSRNAIKDRALVQRPEHEEQVEVETEAGLNVEEVETCQPNSKTPVRIPSILLSNFIILTLGHPQYFTLLLKSSVHGWSICAKSKQFRQFYLEILCV